MQQQLLRQHAELMRAQAMGTSELACVLVGVCVWCMRVLATVEFACDVLANLS